MKNLFALISVCFIVSCSSEKNNGKKIPDVVFANIDTTVKPSEDFFQYANGTWLKANKIPNEESEWGIGNVVELENQKRLRDISDSVSKLNVPKGSTAQKIGDFWSAAMDSNAIEKEGTKNLQPYFDKINSITDVPSLITVCAELNKIGVSALFDDAVGQDQKQSDVMSYTLWQGGLGLPDRDYYFKTDASTVNIRNAYVPHITKVLSLNGADSISAGNAAKNIMALETKLATASRKLEDLRDPYANYHKMAINDLSKLCGNIDWKNMFFILGVKNIDSVIVGQPEFFTALNSVLQTTPVDDWKNYLRYRLLSSYATALPEAYGLENFNFGKLFSGATERKPRWKRVIQTEESVMGELLGQLYVKQYFNETAKKRYSDMMEAIRDAYKERIQKLTWMSDDTKQKALVKLAAIKKKIGYPDKWKDFSAMDISRESYVQNLINAHLWWHNFNVNKLGQPVDRTEWSMYPQTYNAYYDPSNNEMVFPAAAFIVPGYKDEDIDDAVMYGYVGASYIGHEITHGFDDEGRQYDEKGNLRNWWTSKDSAEFAKRAAVMIKQFGEYEPVAGAFINGKSTLGENIADLGGLELGIVAFKKTDVYKKNEMIAGLTPMQRFFLGYALSWMYATRDESLKNRLMTDVHSPAKFRVNGPFVDVDEFYSTFGIKQGDKMYRPDSLRVRIW